MAAGTRQTGRVRVLVAPDCFTGTLTAPEAAGAIEAGWRRHAPGDDVEVCPLSDGGPGFVDVLHRALDGRLLTVTVPGPLGHPVPASVLLVPDEDGVVAYVESAQACGLHLVAREVPPDRRDPGVTTTRGVGALLRAARDAGARRIVVGLGGSGTNDGGAGLLADLVTELRGGRASGVSERLARGGAALAGVTAEDLGDLAALREDWSGIEIALASDVDVPLLGLQGASAGFAAQKGASPERAQELERCLGDFAAAAASALGLDRRVSSTPGAGAAGGLGFGLMLLRAVRIPGVQAVLSAVRFGDRSRRSDLVVTGEGCFDWQSLRGKVVTGVAHEALAAGVPVVVIAGQVMVGRREALEIGVESVYPVARTPAEVEEALADPVATLTARAERVARTWSR
ncbi:MAG: glycerate 2-kinase [Actinomycetota bacterium]|nr:glycerate 2-kinase [Actinomycetota bacterium]